MAQKTRTTSATGEEQMRQRILTLLASATAVLALAACSAVPDSGPVREGLPNLEQVERGVFINPQGPIEDADPESIIRGFVRASSSHLNDYEIARKFLTPTYAHQWEPDSGALVFEGTQQYESTEEGIAVLSLGLAATVDPGGTLQLAAPDEEDEVRFELSRVDGQWRISSAPNGIIIDRANFSSVWETRQLYFVAPDQRLVAEQRWVITNRSSLLPSQIVTQIVRGLISGPSAGMVGAISTAFPAGTELTEDAVPIIDGTAVIDFSSEIFDADDASMSAIKRQLASSLQGLPGVLRFQIAGHGSVLGGGDVAVSEETTSTEFQRIIVLKEGEFGPTSGSVLTPIHGLSERVVGLAPTQVTVTSDLSGAAVLHPGGVSWVTDDQSIGIDRRQDLLAPSVDPQGYVWVYSPSEPDEITVTLPGIGSYELSLPWLSGQDVESVRVSTGGNRLAVLIDHGGTSEVHVAGIIRDETGEPVGITEVNTVQLYEQGAPIDLDWIADNRFVLLSETGLLGGSGKVTIGEVSGRFPVNSGSVSGGISISGGGSSRSLLRVLDDQHRLFKPQGSGWQQLMAGVDLIAKVG